jgi:CRP-like cAMP-binding protein
VFQDFSEQEIEFIETFKINEIVAEAGTTVLEQGSKSAHLYTVLEGWGYRYKSLDDGRLQILNFIMPGDLIGLQGAVLDEMGHSINTLTDMRLCVFERSKLWDLFSGHPTLAFDLTWLASREEALLDENIVSLGRRSAMERIAHVLMMLHDRAIETGAGSEEKMVFPFNQQHLADALGLSLVHTNKTLRKLTTQGLIAWRERSFVLLDRQGMEALAKYDYVEKATRPFI